MNALEEFPLVSIGIPTFNGAPGITKALTSIWLQNYPNLEVIIADNCSSDTTREVVHTMTETHSEIQYYHHQTNIGMIPNFEFVLRKSSGKYFMWLADDDTIAEGALLKYVSFLEAHPEYSLVSGQIKYWLNSNLDISEHGFTFEQKSSSLRVIGYYAKVVYGGMMHGLMRRDLTRSIKLRKSIGNDFHFIANLAYLGEIKNFDFVGYHKNFGGTSKNFKQYAKQIGDSGFAGKFPHIKMAMDAFDEVMYKSQVYSQMPFHAKFTLAASSFSSIMLRYYAGIFPFMVGGKIRRFISNTSQVKL